MANFTTTIELHNANEKEYEKLSTELKGELFKRDQAIQEEWLSFKES